MPVDENGKPLSQFKLARMQAQAEREAAQARSHDGAASHVPKGDPGAAPAPPKAPTPRHTPGPPLASSDNDSVDGGAGRPAHGAAAAGGSVEGSSHGAPSPAMGKTSRQPATTATPVADRGSGVAAQPAMHGRGRSGNDNETVSEKIERYSKFVDETLRVRLAQVLDKREEVVRDIEAFEKLRGTVSVMRESKSSKAKSMVNIGCDIYMQAAIPDTSRIMVNVGLGFFLEFTLEGYRL